MALRYSFGLGEEADLLEDAITGALAAGARTKDIAGPGANALGTAEMGDAIVAELDRRSA
jgi:3-isopropylmalate dehydrogenase